jgi:hypothetical protein
MVYRSENSRIMQDKAKNYRVQSYKPFSAHPSARNGGGLSITGLGSMVPKVLVRTKTFSNKG